jgi:hypothetical protein
LAFYEGSGGASGVDNVHLGGSGGGIIWLSASQSIYLDEESSLKAEGNIAGHFSKPNTTDIAEAWKETSQAHRGSGGGAGGSVQLIMN